MLSHAANAVQLVSCQCVHLWQEGSPVITPKFCVIKVFTKKATFCPGQNQNQNRPAMKLQGIAGMHCDSWKCLKKVPRGRQSKWAPSPVLSATKQAPQDLPGWWGFHIPHLHRYGFPSHLSVSIQIHYFNSTTARCSSPLK